MAQPPAGSSLLFGALADTGRIKARKNGSYRMVLNGVDEIDWFTDRPDRVAGEWSPKKLVRKWDGLFGGVEPNAQASFKMNRQRKLVTFEMHKPKLINKNQTLSFKISGIGKESIDLLTGLKNKQLFIVSIFIDDGSTNQACDSTDNVPSCYPTCRYSWDFNNKNFTSANLSNINLKGSRITNSNLTKANLSLAALDSAQFINSNLTSANLYNATGDASFRNSILGRANLSKTWMSGADFSYTYMPYANLSGANITIGKFQGVNLFGADLTDANLAVSDFTGANLSFARLNDADMSGTKLMYANFQNANLTGANFGKGRSAAKLDGAIWNNTDCPDGTKNSGSSPCSSSQLIAKPTPTPTPAPTPDPTPIDPTPIDPAPIPTPDPNPNPSLPWTPPSNPSEIPCEPNGACPI